MSDAVLKLQLRQLNERGIKKKLLIQELGGKTNWHTIQNYFDNNPKMNPVKRLALEGAISGVIRKYS